MMGRFQDGSKAALIGSDSKNYGSINERTSHADTSLGTSSTVPAGLAIDPEAERLLVRKFDLRILPCLAIMYLFNSLDKSNLANARTAGMEQNLGLKGDQYNLLVSLFYIPYVIAAPFLAAAGKKYGPSRALPLMMLTFGLATVCVVVTKTFAGMMTLRWVLGIAESAFFALVIYYQTTFYRRGELARRLAIFYAASSIGSAFSGLLAYLVFQIQSGPLASWRYLFLVEGSSTVLFSLFALYWLPHDASTATFLTDEEKSLARYRMQVDSSAVITNNFNLKGAIRVLYHPTSWLILLIEVCLGVPLQSVSLFLPIIIGRFGYSSVTTNLYTVLPNVTGAIALLILAFASDHTRLRFPFIATGFALTCMGFLVFATVDLSAQPHIAYFSTFLMTWGISAPSVLVNVWYNNNVADQSQRVLLTSLAVPLANSMGLVSGNIFFDSEAPKYGTALAITAAFGAVGCCATLVLGAWMAWDNRTRDRRQGRVVKAQDVPTLLLADGPNGKDYRWFL